MNQNDKNTLRAVVNTLNTIEVKGRENMDRLLGCIMALEHIMAQQEEPQDGPEISIVPVTEGNGNA